MSWYLEVLKKYAQFNGRARRKEYWFFALFNMLAYMILMIPAMIAIAGAARTGHAGASMALMVPVYLYGFAVIIPGLAVTVRRLHDTGRAGVWCLIAFVPFVGGIVLLVLMLLEGQPGPNQYGPSPKAVPGYGQMAPIVSGY